MGADRRERRARAAALLAHALGLAALARCDGSFAAHEGVVVATWLLWGAVEARLRPSLEAASAAELPMGIAWFLLMSCSLLFHEGAPLWAGLGVLVPALGLRWASVATLKEGYTDGVTPVTPHRVTKGPYALLRHPGELAALGIGLGSVAVLRSAAGALVLVLLLAPLSFRRMREEDRALLHDPSATPG